MRVDTRCPPYLSPAKAWPSVPCLAVFVFVQRSRLVISQRDATVWIGQIPEGYISRRPFINGPIPSLPSTTTTGLGVEGLAGKGASTFGLASAGLRAIRGIRAPFKQGSHLIKQARPSSWHRVFDGCIPQSLLAAGAGVVLTLVHCRPLLGPLAFRLSPLRGST